MNRVPLNPFATQYTRPGALAFRWPQGWSLDRLVDELARHGWWGEIVGPHGSGKSSLLAHLMPACAPAGRTIVERRLHEGEWRLPFTRADMQTWSPRTLVVVDGYEQLGCWAKLRLKAACRKRKCGLLVTSHVATGLPRLWTTEVEAQVAREIVSSLLAGGEAHSITNADVDAALARHPGNLREALFALYDLYELRRPRP